MGRRGNPGEEDLRYRAVRVGPRTTDDLERARYPSTPMWPMHPRESGRTERLFVCLPAPPEEVGSVTLHAGALGSFEVPVE